MVEIISNGKVVRIRLIYDKRRADAFNNVEFKMSPQSFCGRGIVIIMTGMINRFLRHRQMMLDKSSYSNLSLYPALNNLKRLNDYWEQSSLRLCCKGITENQQLLRSMYPTAKSRFRNWPERIENIITLANAIYQYLNSNEGKGADSIHSEHLRQIPGFYQLGEVQRDYNKSQTN